MFLKVTLPPIHEILSYEAYIAEMRQLPRNFYWKNWFQHYIIEFSKTMVLTSHEFWSGRNVIIKLVAIWRTLL